MHASFALVEDNSFVNAPSPMIVPASYYLLGVLNSKLADYYIRRLGVTRNGGYFEYKPMFVEQLPIPIDNGIKPAIEQAAKIQDEQQIDHCVYSMYKLTDEEIRYIESRNV